MPEIRIEIWGSGATTTNPHTHILTLPHLHTHTHTISSLPSITSQTPAITLTHPPGFVFDSTIDWIEIKESDCQKETYRSPSDSSRSKVEKQQKRQAEVFTHFLRLRLNLNKKKTKESQTITYRANRRYVASEWVRVLRERNTYLLIRRWLESKRQETISVREKTYRTCSRIEKRDELWRGLGRTVLYIFSLSFVLSFLSLEVRVDQRIIEDPELESNVRSAQIVSVSRTPMEINFAEKQFFWSNTLWRTRIRCRFIHNHFLESNDQPLNGMTFSVYGWRAQKCSLTSILFAH